MTDRSNLPHIPHANTAASVSSRSPSEGLANLQGRLLIQMSHRKSGWVVSQIDTKRSGLILCGGGAEKKAIALRSEEKFEGPILIDPAVYEDRFATEENPFHYDSDEGLFFNDPLRHALFDQREAGVTLPMTPTGYIRGEDSDALRAAVKQVRELDDPEVIFTVPVDVVWLKSEESTRQLIAYLKTVECPKALMLGAQMDPLDRYSKAVANLRLIMTQVPDIALLRTDLAAFGALAAGASFTAIGMSGRLRHIVPPNEQTQTGGRSKSPHVLFPELKGFFLGETIANRFAGTNAPSCSCAACEGERRFDSFISLGDGNLQAAAAHNIAILMQWVHSLSKVELGFPRQQWWYKECQNALDEYVVINTSIRQPEGFKPPKQLIRWVKAAPEAVPPAVQPVEAESSR
jgi:hypothetical protein